MLDDDEWSIVHEAFRAGEGARTVLEEARRARSLPPMPPISSDADYRDRRFWALMAGYQLFTGVPETNPNAVWHHVASLYGPPCRACGKPLRTPVAKLCAACGAYVDTTAAPA